MRQESANVAVSARRRNKSENIINAGRCPPLPQANTSRKFKREYKTRHHKLMVQFDESELTTSDMSQYDTLVKHFVRKLDTGGQNL